MDANHEPVDRTTRVTMSVVGAGGSAGGSLTEEQKLAQLPSHVAAAVSRRRDAEHQQDEAAIRATLVRRVETAIDSVLDNGDYGDASGHLGGDGIAEIANAAVDEFIASARGGITRADVVGPGALNITPASVIINGVEYFPRNAVRDFLEHDKALCASALDHDPEVILRAAEMIHDAEQGKS